VRTRRELLASVAATCAAAAGLRSTRTLLAEDIATPDGRRVPVEEGGIAPRPARWWKPLPQAWVQCGLCPRGCKISDGERGTCGVRENRNGLLYTLVHSRPCSVALDPIEKKPFFHFLPGAPALSLATPGCNFECRCCQNWEIAQARPEQVPTSTVTPEQVAQLAVRRAARVVACTYTEPVVFSEYVFDIAVAARKAGVKTVVVSNGSIQEEPLRDLCSVLSGYKVDLKSFSERFYREQCRGELKPVLDTLQRLRRHGVWTEIVVLVIPTLNDSEAELRSLARFVKGELGAEVPLHFTRFHPTYRLTNLPPTPVATLERAREIALAEGLAFVYVGNVPGHAGESTWCPGCQARLIRRVGMATLENRLRKGACPDCGRAIPGVWS
jgi:pyruvate formate lyase activating enzyme